MQIRSTCVRGDRLYLFDFPQNFSVVVRSCVRKACENLFSQPRKMSDAEVQNKKRGRDAHETKSATIAVSGFILSVFFILWGLVILVRFYIFDNLLYNLFLVCMLATGIIFNIASVNLLLCEITDKLSVLPFVVGSPITLFWTILCICLSIFDGKFFSQFSYMPIAVYDAQFYDGIGYDPNSTSVPRIAEHFKAIQDRSFFEHNFLILALLVIAAMAQTAFWVFSFGYYKSLSKEQKENVGCSKNL